MHAASDSQHRTALEGDLTIYRAAEIKERLIPPISAHRETELDLSGVSEIDSAGLQLLLLAAKEARRHQHAFRLSFLSQPVEELLALYNLHGYFID